MDKLRSNKPVVILVHGTFAADENDDRVEGQGNRWWQRNSQFSLDLNQVLDGSLHVAANNAELGWDEEFTTVFHWSGQNSEIARRAAGALLLTKLQSLEERSQPYYLIGHSHGGNVLWHALTNAAGGRFDGLPNLRGWITVGTPFLHFIPNLQSLAKLLIVPALWCVLRRQIGWVADFWNGVLVATGWAWWSKALVSPLIVVGAAILTAMLLHFCYRLFCLQRAQKDPRPRSEIPQIELARSLRSLVWLVGAALVATVFLGVSAYFCDAQPVESLRAVFTEPSIWWANLYSVLAAIMLWLAVWPSVRFVMVAADMAARRKKLLITTWKRFGERYSCVLAPLLDEAFLGLRASVPGLAGPLLPKIRAPGSQYFGNALGRLRAPELKESGYGTLLVSIPREWIVAPFYNNIVAPLLDSYVLGKLTRQAQGVDLPELSLGAVTPLPLPVPTKNRRFVRLREKFARLFEPAADSPSLAATWRGPTAAVCVQLETATQDQAGRLLTALRKDLCVDSPTAISLQEIPQNAMQGQADGDLLVHTSYFKNRDVTQLLADCLRPERRPVANPTDTKWFEDALLSASVSRESHFPWPPSGMGWWLLRGAVLLLLASSLGLVLAYVGAWVLYPYSREAGLTWAQDITYPTLDAAKEKGHLDQQPQSRQTARFARWQMGLTALGLEPTLREFESALRPWCSELELLHIQATVGQKLIELGERDRGLALLQNSALRLNQTPSTPDKAAHRIQIEHCLQSVAALYPDCGIILPSGYMFLQPAPKFSVDFDEPLLAHLSAAVSANVLLGAEWDAVDLRKGLQALGAAADRTPSFNYPSFRGILPQVLERVRRYQQEGGTQTFAILMSLLTLRNICLAYEDSEWSAHLLSACEHLCDGLMELKGLDGLPLRQSAVESWLLLAKTCRRPDEVDRSVNVFLNKANAIAASAPLGIVAELRGKIAGAYARLGHFRTARQLADGAPTAERVRVAKDILANEYEQNQLVAAKSTREEMTIRRRIQVAFDEQNDPLRKPVDYPQ